MPMSTYPRKFPPHHPSIFNAIVSIQRCVQLVTITVARLMSCLPLTSSSSAIMNNSKVNHQSVAYNPRIHRKIHQNINPFVLCKYDARIKKCRGCKLAFTITTQKFVISHRELYVYGREKGSKRLLKAERSFFYHCRPSCIKPRHPYFDPNSIKTDIRVSDSDIELLRLRGIFLQEL